MGRIYTISFENVAVTAVQDLFEVNPASNKPMQLVGWGVFQRSDVGDAEEELLRITINRTTASFASGSGGSTPTAVRQRRGDSAFSGAPEVNNTTVSTGTQEIYLPRNPNIRVGEDVFLPPEMRPEFINGEPLIVKLVTAPNDSLTMSGYIIVEEFG